MMEALLVPVLSFIRDWWGPLLAGLGIIFRESIITFIATKVSQENLKQLEQMKSNLRVGENAKRDMSQHVVKFYDAYSDRLIAKKMEAAEDLLRARYLLARYQRLTQYMQLFDMPKILLANNENVAALFKTIMRPYKDSFDGFKYDKTGPLLYLSERTLRVFEIYETIIINAYITCELVGHNIKNQDKILKKDTKLIQRIIEYVPASEEGFKKFGEYYAYFWASYFYEEIKNVTRQEILDLGETKGEIIKVKDIISQSYEAMEEVMKKLEGCGKLPTNPVFENERTQDN